MKSSPPNKALKFLRWFCREDYLDEIEGDLIEMYEFQSDKSPKHARRQLFWNVIRSFRIRNIKKIGEINLNRKTILKHYIKIGWRHMLKNKVYSIINIKGLSIGLTCCLILLLFVNYESNFDNYHQQSDQTFRVVQHTQFPEQMLYWNTTAYPLAEALRTDFKEIKLVTQTAGPLTNIFSLTGVDGEISRFEEDYVLFADPYYPVVFDLRWVSGHPGSALAQTNSIILTEKIARKYFGENYDPNALLGTIINLNNNDPLKITGIVQNPPGNTNLIFDLIIPYEFFKINNQYHSGNWSGNYQGTTFVMLENPISEREIESKIASWKSKYLKPQDDKRINYFLQPLGEIHTEVLYGSSPGSYVMPQSVLTSATFVALFILVIAIINFVNLGTAQATERAKEVGIRKVMGCSRFGVIKQFIVENAIMVIVSVMVALLITQLLLQYLNEFLSVLNLQLAFHWSDFKIVLLTAILTTFLAAIYPALVISSFKPIPALKKVFLLKSNRGVSLRKSLMVLQFSIVQLFVIGTIIAGVQMNFFKSKGLGFTSDAVLIVPTPDYNKIKVFNNTLVQNNNISKITIGSGPPMAVEDFSLGTTFRLPHQPPELGQKSEMKIGDNKYLDFFDLKLLAGRNLTENKTEFDEFIVNEKLISALGWSPEEAIGKKLKINEGEATIIGVVQDFHNNSLQVDITPCIILNWHYFQDKAFIKINNGNHESLAKIEETWKATFPEAVYHYQFLDETIEKEYVVENLIYKGFNIFSILVIVIGCLGLMGLLAFMISNKTKEIGIRKVLGATIMNITSLLSREYLILICISFVIAVPAIYYLMNQWLQNFTYRIELTVWMFLTGGLITILITALTSSIQIFKAAITNPIKSLRSE